jgi:hypothetical protein
VANQTLKVVKNHPMTLPSFLIGIVISSLYGAIFHLWRGGGFGRLILYIILAWIGFWIGHFAGDALGWSFASLGPLHLGTATLGAVIMLLFGYWLSLIDR